MKVIRIGTILLCLASLTACNINTLYNAKKYFKSAQDKPLNVNGKPNNQAIEEYTKTIKKCGIIITERKKGAQLDDAVFLMAKALYFKGNSAFQAKDQFENLIKGFPSSRYVAESNIFIAMILRDINQPKDAERRLDEFVRNPKFKKEHPKALLLLTDFAIRDKDYTKAQYWLERIIRDYSKTNEYRTAYFLFGKNYFEQKEYKASLAAFEKMQGSRRIDKTLKLDTRYYIAMNQLELGDFGQAYRTCTSLLRNETRLDRIPAIKLLKARIHFAKGENTEAKKEIDEINKTYPRTESSAAAYYYLAEFQYYQAGDPASAVTNYTRVSAEFTTSPLRTMAQQKSTAITSTLPRANLSSETGLKALLDYQYQAAESFLSFLALPDSALVRYRLVISERDTLSSKLAKLQDQVVSVTALLDSLRIASIVKKETVIEEQPASQDEVSTTDSMAVGVDSSGVAIPEHPEPADSLMTEEGSLGTTVAEPSELVVNPVGDVLSETLLADSLDVSEFMPDIPDSLAVTMDSLQVAEAKPTEDDTSAEVIKPKPDNEPAKPAVDVAVTRQVTQQEQLISTLNSRKNTLEEIITQFDTDIIPFCLFAIGSVIHDSYPNSDDNAETLALLQATYPNNKYTRALQSLQQGLPVRLIDPYEESQEAKLDELLGLINTQADSALVGLEEMRLSSLPQFRRAANFRLGWYYCFDAPDTTAAREYLQAVLDDTNAGDYATVTRRFYDGRRFLLWDMVSVDSLVFADSLLSVDSLSVTDSLSVEADTLQSYYQEQVEESIQELEPVFENPDTQAPEPSPAMKEEDAKLE